MSQRVALITDSTCDLPAELLQQYEVAVVPSFVVWGSDVLADRVDLQPEEFYRRLTTDRAYPTTAHPAPADFGRLYEVAQRQGAEGVVVITVSSAMSGTHDAAQQAAAKAPLPVHVVDSRGPTMTVGWQVLAAARAREAGGDAQAMIAAADRVRRGLVQIVYLDTLDYLHKGGRIGGAAHLIGTLLNIKLLVHINHETGLVEPEGRARTRKSGIEQLYQAFFRQLDTSRPLHIAVLHGNCRPDAEALAERIRQEYRPQELLISVTGPVLGVHTGPGALALCGYSEPLTES